MKFENKGKWVKQINESLSYKNEVRYINPDNLDKYNPDEIEEVTTKSGEKRYKRKAGQTPVAKKEEPKEKKEPASKEERLKNYIAQLEKDLSNATNDKDKKEIQDILTMAKNKLNKSKDSQQTTVNASKEDFQKISNTIKDLYDKRYKGPSYPGYKVDLARTSMKKLIEQHPEILNYSKKDKEQIYQQAYKTFAKGVREELRANSIFHIIRDTLKLDEQ